MGQRRCVVGHREGQDDHGTSRIGDDGDLEFHRRRRSSAPGRAVVSGRFDIRRLRLRHARKPQQRINATEWRRRHQTSGSYGYVQQGSGGSIIGWADSPRWAAGGPDGGVTSFGFSGNSPATATLSAIGRFGTVNPAIPDGTNSGPLQAGHPSTLYEYYDEFYTTGGPNATFRDTDGHATNWVIDSQGRPTQTQECTVVVNQACNPGAYTSPTSPGTRTTIS